MEGGESLLDTLFDEEGVEDVEMPDVEEGELIDQIPETIVGESSEPGGNQGNQESKKPNSRRKKKKRKNKPKRGGNAGPNVTDIHRFVIDACKRLREKKSYLIYTAVGCLGLAALSDLIKEVDAIQTCGGQKTADGSRFRNGGGILWNIIKSRDPNAYKEIMKKGNKFEKEFKQQIHDKQEPQQSIQVSFESARLDANQVNENPSGGMEIAPDDHSQHEALTAGQKRAPVHDRLRVPVAYDDLLGAEDPKDELA